MVYETKLVGIMISSNAKWNSHTNYICKKSSKKCWLLQRLKKLGASTDQLISVYEKQIRSKLEMAAPAWHGSLSKQNQNLIEREQKKAFAIILGLRYKNYKQALLLLEKDTLFDRREKATLKFAKKCLKDPRHADMFPTFGKNITVRQKKPYIEQHCRTKRFYDSAIPYMTRMLNADSIS